MENTQHASKFQRNIYTSIRVQTFGHIDHKLLVFSYDRKIYFIVLKPTHQQTIKCRVMTSSQVLCQRYADILLPNKEPKLPNVQELESSASKGELIKPRNNFSMDWLLFFFNWNHLLEICRTISSRCIKCI